NHRIGFGIEKDLFAYDGWIAAKAPLPESPRQHHGRIRLGAVVRRLERPSYSWLHSKRGKQVPRAQRCCDLLRQLAALSGNVVRSPGVSQSHLLEARGSL